ncbi:periplasmic heavy metal sensor [Verrucomicrobiaceae bacterium 227]
MNRRSLLFTVIAAALVAALITSLITMNWHRHGKPGHHTRAITDTDFHHWLHDNLALTEEQEKALHPLEYSFRTEQLRLQEEISQAADALAHEIRNQDHAEPAIDDALQRLNHSQVELQKLTLAHFFQMKKQLTPEQSEKLLRWTHDSIVGNHSH